MSVLEGRLLAVANELEAARGERDRAAQGRTLAELQLRELTEDYERVLADTQAFKARRSKESGSLRLQCSTLLSKLGAAENELLGTRKLYDHKKAAADELKAALAAAHAELNDLKRRLNLA